MARERSLSEKELKRINNLRQKNQQLLVEYGQIGLAKEDIKNREENAKKKLDDLKVEEQELMDELQRKYKNGSIDLDKGVFTPADTNEQVVVEEEEPATIFDESANNERI